MGKNSMNELYVKCAGDALGGEYLIAQYEESCERKIALASFSQDRGIVVTGLWDTFSPDLDDYDRAVIRKEMGC